MKPSDHSNSDVPRSNGESYSPEARDRNGAHRADHLAWPLAPNSSARPVRFLVIEDSETDAFLIRTEIESVFGATEISAVSTLAEGIERAGADGFDICLLDLNLPDSAGPETFESLHQSHPKLPIIVLTGLADEAVAREVLGRGAQDYLQKSTRLAPLMARAIGNAIERHRLASERERQTRELQEAEKRIRTMIEANADAIVIVDFDGIIQFANPMAAQMFGQDRDRLAGQPFGFPAASGQIEELDIRRADGSIGVAEMRVVQIRWGESLALMASLRDVTERKRAQEEICHLNEELERRVAERTAELREAKERAESSDRMKSAFLAAMSHELRTPLNGIIGFSEFLVDGKAGSLNAKQTEYLHDVLNSGRHLLQLINNVLDLSKIEAGKMVFAPEPFRLSRALDEVCAVIFPIAQQKRVEIRCCVDPAVDRVVLDLSKFKQVLYNLIANAVKFNRDRGRVEITVTEAESRRLSLCVRDTGIGIAPENLGQLFQEFQQLDSGRARRYEGTGLGLALTQRIVALQKGEIRVESTLGVGSAFIVELPRIAETVLDQTEPRRISENSAQTL